jgi:hypothetical protein
MLRKPLPHQIDCADLDVSVLTKFTPGNIGVDHGKDCLPLSHPVHTCELLREMHELPEPFYQFKSFEEICSVTPWSKSRIFYLL